MNSLFQARYGDVLEMAKEGEQRCFQGMRWNGNAVLIVVDAALDSIGLKYFQIVVPRVRRFWGEYIKTGEITSFRDFSRLSPRDSRLRRIMNNERCWRVAIGVCKILDQIRTEEKLSSDFAALKFWAERANHEGWRRDPVGAISGVGLITFQYLRMQAGVDTTMPDKIIKRVAEDVFNIDARDDLDFIKKMEALSSETGYSQTLICWAIWLKESDMKTPSWERTG
ncbi:MAG: hypothetical protein JSW01_05665 [Candidatus Bathyarchaeota archaeon]|nr:MAG: hypothetical protein JSW01_05665 [Candidatus Bathyarchaeota archaeon]